MTLTVNNGSFPNFNMVYQFANNSSIKLLQVQVFSDDYYPVMDSSSFFFCFIYLGLECLQTFCLLEALIFALFYQHDKCVLADLTAIFIFIEFRDDILQFTHLASKSADFLLDISQTLFIISGYSAFQLFYHSGLIHCYSLCLCLYFPCHNFSKREFRNSMP